MKFFPTHFNYADDIMHAISPDHEPFVYPGSVTFADVPPSLMPPDDLTMGFALSVLYISKFSYVNTNIKLRLFCVNNLSLLLYGSSTWKAIDSVTQSLRQHLSATCLQGTLGRCSFE